jgi:hypothetical protein
MTEKYRIVRIPTPDPDVYDEFAVVGPGGYYEDGFTTHVTALFHALKMANDALDSSRVRETAKELPDGDYGDRVLGFDRRCQQWREADVGCIRGMEGRLLGKGYYTHWMPKPPAPKEASDVG